MKSQRAFFEQLIAKYEQPKRRAVTSRFPSLLPLVLTLRESSKTTKDHLAYRLAGTRKTDFFPNVIARHQSVLRRRLGNSPSKLQTAKIINLQRACRDLNGVIIYPKEIFSLWHLLGEPTQRKGYVAGMLLSEGQVSEGIGGGLCQMSNFLCWIFLHAPMQIVERYHHSKDVFPDSGRVLPFGSGATCMHNLIDLKFRNIGHTPIQLKIWVTDTHLKGQLLSSARNPQKFSIIEKNHIFIKSTKGYYRFNEIWRLTKIKGKVVAEQKLFTNFAPVLYKVTSTYLKQHGYRLLDLTKAK